MKFALSAVLLFCSVLANAESVKLNLPEAGRYIVTLTSPASCMPAQFTIIPLHTSWSKKSTALLSASVGEVIETRGRAQMCYDGNNIATGILVVMEPTEVEIDLDAAGGALASPEVKLETVPVQ